MPTYIFINKKTGEESTEFMSISEMEKLIKENKNIELKLSSPAIADPTRLGLRKPDQGFRDRLKEIKKKHIRSTINTW